MLPKYLWLKASKLKLISNDEGSTGNKDLYRFSNKKLHSFS